MVQNSYIKIEKISHGRLDTLGLPVYEYAWVPRHTIIFEDQVWFRGYEFNAKKYQHDIAMHSQANMFGSVSMKNGVRVSVSNPTQLPNMKSDIYFTEVIEGKEFNDSWRNTTTFKKYFINGYEVSEQEMQRIARLIGCEL